MNQRQVVRLVPSVESSTVGLQSQNWLDALEWVTQDTIEASLERSGRRAPELESIEFLDALDVRAQADAKGQGEPLAELQLFANRVAAFEFRLHEREYVSIEHNYRASHVSDTAATSRDNVSLLQRLAVRIGDVVPQKGMPTTDELLHILLAHLVNRDARNEKSLETEIIVDGKPGIQQLAVHPLHATRCSEVFTWQERLEKQCLDAFNHDSALRLNYVYPYVDAKVVDGQHLIIALATPLDENFVDAKVELDDRVFSVVLAIYDVRNHPDRGVVHSCLPLLTKSFARALFCVRADRSSDVVAASFGELATIAKRWYTWASDGLAGVMDDDSHAGRFDGIAFCEAFVRRMLCRLDGVSDTEVYPWNRAFIFREGGASAEFNPDKPIELLVLEAAIKSENPADRGEWLTRRERRVRDTEDFQCRKADKVIKDESRFVFYLHGHESGLVLSRKANLKAAEVADAFNSNRASSLRAGDANYPIRLPEDNDDRLSEVIYNLFGSLIRNAHDGTEFTDDFFQRRLKVNQRADEHGLYFDYDHGLNLEREVPLLFALQEAYKDYLTDQFAAEDAQQRLQRRGRAPTEIGKKKERRNAKVVCISFSADLHDENSRRQREDKRREKKNDVVPVLGSECAFTMILVSDDEPEKTRPQIQRESDDLKTVFQMIMHQVWMDRLNEHQYLKSRSTSISESLSQFVHRAKGLISGQHDDAVRARQELDNLGRSFRSFIEQGRVAEAKNFSGAQDVLLALMTDTAQKNATSDPAVALQERARTLVGPATLAQLHLSLTPVTSGPLDVWWSDAIIRDAFDNLLKNACEAAVLGKRRRPDQAAEVSVRIEIVPLHIDGEKARGYLQIVVHNTGGPVPPQKLKELNAPEPKAIGKNHDKEASTGVGLFLARFQLRESVRRGQERGDIVILNVGDDRVETRLVLPAELQLFATDVEAADVDMAPESSALRDYVLYVEDDQSNYQPTLDALRNAMHGLDVVHAKGRNRALGLVRQKLPALIVSDFHITATEADGESGVPIHGVNFLSEAMKHCSTHNPAAAPPIWVITAEDQKDVLGHFIEPSYDVQQHLPSNLDAIVSPRVLCVLQCAKKPFDSPGFVDLVQHFLKRRSPDRAPTPVQDAPKHLLRLPWTHTPAGLSTLERAVAGQHEDRELLVAVDATATTQAALAQVLASWHGHRGLVEPEYRGGIYPLTRHMWHNRLVLVLELGPELHARVTPMGGYWALTNNVWLTRRPLDDREVDQQWRIMRHESTGPISAVRHDVKNKFNAFGLNDLLDRFTSASQLAEKVLRLPEDKQRELHEGLAQDAGGSLAGVLGEAGEVASSRRLAVGQIVSMQATLGEAMDHLDPSGRAMIDGHRTSLDCLMRMIGGHL